MDKANAKQTHLLSLSIPLNHPHTSLLDMNVFLSRYTFITLTDASLVNNSDTPKRTVGTDAFVLVVAHLLTLQTNVLAKQSA